jgi:hypothetical protein
MSLQKVELILTVPNLFFGNLALLFNVKSAHEEMPLALETSRSRDTDLGGWWRRQTFHPCYSHLIFPNLLHLDIGDICGYITVVV